MKSNRGGAKPNSGPKKKADDKKSKWVGFTVKIETINKYGGLTDYKTVAYKKLSEL